MSITKTINFYDFLDEFKGSSYENNFSFEGKKLLFEYLNDLSDETGEDIELDIVCLCCDYTEYTGEEIINEALQCDIQDIIDYFHNTLAVMPEITAPTEILEKMTVEDVVQESDIVNNINDITTYSIKDDCYITYDYSTCSDINDIVTIVKEFYQEITPDQFYDVIEDMEYTEN